jgi:hypothetical protein
MSDYIDENFEMDETEEYWGLSAKNEVKDFGPHDNFIREIDRRAFHMTNEPGIRSLYQYVEKRVVKSRR